MSKRPALRTTVALLLFHKLLSLWLHFDALANDRSVGLEVTTLLSVWEVRGLIPG